MAFSQLDYKKEAPADRRIIFPSWRGKFL